MVCAVAGCRAAQPPTSLSGKVYSSQQAVVRATALLDRIYVPGAVRTNTPLSSFSGTGSYQVEMQRWFTVLRQSGAIIADLESHPPQGLEAFAPPFQTTATSAPLSTVLAGLRPVGQADQSQTVEVLATDVGGGRSQVRVQATVGWSGKHSALETIPADVTDVQLALSRANQPDEAMNRDNALTPAQVRALAAQINALDVGGRGSSPACFDPVEATALLSLTYGGHQATFVIQIGGCYFVYVTVDGVAQPPLFNDEAVGHLIGDILGVSL